MWTAPLNTVISRLKREIELLREYRTRLVADVVTGKLDIRDTVSRLPEQDRTATTEEPADGLDEIELSDEEATA
jgi:type I restriction enzyme S subunit